MRPIPEPYHRWSANEGLDAPKAFSMRDRCLTCGVSRQSHLSGKTGVWVNSIAAGPCPQKPWREVLDTPDLASYVIDYVDKPTTQSEREALAEAQAESTR